MQIDTPSKARTARLEGKVEFEFFAPEAKKVQIAGDFNNWDPDKSPLKKALDDKWRITLQLKPGRYEYRYFVDGNWQNDQRSVECVPNVFGTWNCVAKVQ